MSDINRRKVEDSKMSNVDPAKPVDEGVKVSWGNSEKIKILLLQAINNNIVALRKEIEALKENK